MMTKKTLIVTFAALALALVGGCKKKDAAENKAPPTTGSNKDPGSGAVKDPGAGSMGSAKPPVTPLTGEALGKMFLDGWATWNAGDKAKFQAMYTADAVAHHPDQEPAELKGADAVVADAFNFRAGFPDAKGAPQLVLVNGRVVVAAVLLTGTNTGAMKTPTGDMPAMNKKIGMMVFHGVSFNDANLITEEWWVMDGNTFANQLGMSPQPGRPLMEKGADAPTIVVSTGNDVEKANLAATTKGNADFNKHDLAALMAGWADDGIESDQSSPADVVGKANIEQGTKMFLGAFTDGKIEPIVTLAAGDYVFQASTFVGTNDGDMGPMKKTGKNAKMTVVEISKFDAGKVKQLWRFFDSAAMAKQLGMMDDAAKAPPAPAKTN